MNYLMWIWIIRRQAEVIGNSYREYKDDNIYTQCYYLSHGLALMTLRHCKPGKNNYISKELLEWKLQLGMIS